MLSGVDEQLNFRVGNVAGGSTLPAPAASPWVCLLSPVLDWVPIFHSVSELTFAFQVSMTFETT